MCDQSTLDIETTVTPQSQDYIYFEAICENEPAPGKNDLSFEGHHQQLLTSTTPSEEKINQLKEILTPKECPACNGSVKTDTIKGKWPPENPTSEEILSLFRDTKGNFTIEFDPEEDSKFYISEIGGKYCVETIHHTRPDQSYSVDNLPKLITSIPNRLRNTDNTTLSGHLEDYQNGL